MNQSITIALPWPPSVNRIWRQFKGRTLLSKEGRDYRQAVAVKCMLLGLHRLEPIAGPVRLELDAFVPDRRKRDLDNLTKAPLDALTHANIWVDDTQITEMRLVKHPVGSPPGIRVRITPL